MNTADEIETLLHAGARRHGLTVEAYRSRAEEIAAGKGEDLRTVLASLEILDVLGPERLAQFEAAIAERLGVSLEQLYEILGGQRKAEPAANQLNN